MPLEPVVLAREASGGRYALTEAEEAPLLARCEELGLKALDVPWSARARGARTCLRPR